MPRPCTCPSVGVAPAAVTALPWVLDSGKGRLLVLKWSQISPQRRQAGSCARVDQGIVNLMLEWGIRSRPFVE